KWRQDVTLELEGAGATRFVNRELSGADGGNNDFRDHDARVVSGDGILKTRIEGHPTGGGCEDSPLTEEERLRRAVSDVLATQFRDELRSAVGYFVTGQEGLDPDLCAEVRCLKSELGSMQETLTAQIAMLTEQMKEAARIRTGHHSQQEMNDHDGEEPTLFGGGGRLQNAGGTSGVVNSMEMEQQQIITLLTQPDGGAAPGTNSASRVDSKSNIGSSPWNLTGFTASSRPGSRMASKTQIAIDPNSGAPGGNSNRRPGTSTGATTMSPPGMTHREARVIEVVREPPAAVHKGGDSPADAITNSVNFSNIATGGGENAIEEATTSWLEAARLKSESRRRAEEMR
ncbi:unnamed protein product, partial [Amoebophrya sp. A25]